MYFRRLMRNRTVKTWEKNLAAKTPDDVDLGKFQTIRMWLSPTYWAAADAFADWDQDFHGLLAQGGPDAHYFNAWQDAAQRHLDYLKR